MLDKSKTAAAPASQQLEIKDSLVAKWKSTLKGRLSFYSLWKIRAILSKAGHRDLVILKHVEKNSTILDLACGAGIPWLKDYGIVYGLDQEESLIKEASKYYFNTSVGSIDNIPYKSNSFDYVICRDVIGHVDDKIILDCYNEIFRVLKPGGKAILTIELAVDNIVTGVLKYHNLYEERYVNLPGHINLKSLHSHLKVLAINFFILDVYKIGLLPGVISAFWFDIKSLHPALKLLYFIDKIISKYSIIRELVTVSLGRGTNSTNPMIATIVIQKP